MSMTFGSLFAGIGGLDLGLERAGMACKWQVEIDDYATRVLAKHWPDVPKYRDVRSVGAHNLSHVDLICGGFPCQDISNAGQRAGINGGRSGLWGEYSRLISELRPRFVLVENVAALLVRGMGRVLGDLAAIGYDAEWSVVSACALDAPHTRERVFIVAYSQGRPRHALRGQQLTTSGDAQGIVYPWNKGQPPVDRVVDGVPARMDRLRGLGNAVVPQVAEYIGRMIVEYDNSC